MDIPVKVLKHYLAKSENGTPSIKFQLETPTGEKLYWDGWLTDKAIRSTIKTLKKVFGYQGKGLEEINGTSLFVGKKASAYCEEEEYAGKVRLRVKFLNPDGAEQFSSEEIEHINKRFSEQMGLPEEPENQPPAPPKRDEPPTADGLPF